MINQLHIDLKVKIAIILGVSHVSFILFIEKWVWSPAWALAFFMVVMLLDFMFAVLASLKNKKDFETKKAMWFAVKFFGQIAMLGMVFNFPKLSLLLSGDSVTQILAIAPDALFTIMFASNVLSVIKNMTLCGVFSGAVKAFFDKYVDTKKNHK